MIVKMVAGMRRGARRNRQLALLIAAACLATAPTCQGQSTEKTTKAGAADDAFSASKVGSAKAAAALEKLGTLEDELDSLYQQFVGRNLAKNPTAAAAQLRYMEVLQIMKKVPPAQLGNATTIDNDDDILSTMVRTRKISQFVYAKTNGQFATRRLLTDGTWEERPFFFAGTNQHNLAYSHIWSYAQINSILRDTARQGLKVVRLWCFNSSQKPWEKPLQTEINQYNEEAFKYWDYVFHRAGIHGIRVICTLSNNWDDYGGKRWWVEKVLGTGTNSNKFYHTPRVVRQFKRYIKTWALRTNTFNGLQYRNDPVIFAWQLQNEPTAQLYENFDETSCVRCTLQPGTVIRQWGCSLAYFLKKLGVKQMISLGDEGYRADGRTNVPQFNWMNGGMKGVDFVRNLACPHLDFATIHYYPEAFGVPQFNLSYFVRDFLADRAEIAAYLKKPIIVEEFGLSRRTSSSERTFLYEQIRKTAAYHRYSGFLLWEFWPSSVTVPYGIGLNIDETMPEFLTMRRFINWANTRNNPDLKAFVPPPAAPPCEDQICPYGYCACDAGFTRRTCRHCRHWRGWDAFSYKDTSRAPRIWQ